MEVPADTVNGLSAARPALIRALNEQLLLEHIRLAGPCSRADLARVSGLSKPTVSLGLANLERAGLVRLAGQRTGLPGRSALLYEVRPEAGFVLGLDVGMQYLRGAVCDLAGVVRARESRAVTASVPLERLAELVRLADDLCSAAGISRSSVTQTVVGSPGVYDHRRDIIMLTGSLPGWDQPEPLAGLRTAFGPALTIENDVDVAALGERALGAGKETDSFAFVHVGTGIGMGLVLGGRLHRGAHGVAGEIAFMPFGASVADRPGAGRPEAGRSLADRPGADGVDGAGADGSGVDGAGVDRSGGDRLPGGDRPGGDDPGGDRPGGDRPGGASVDSASVDDEAVSPAEMRRRGMLEIAAAAGGIVRAARRAGMEGSVTARSVFEAAERGDARAASVVAAEARLVASAICCVITVVDPSLIVLGGGVGQAPGFADAVRAELATMAPVVPEVRVSALGTEVVVDGCLAAGTALAWTQLVAALP